MVAQNLCFCAGKKGENLYRLVSIRFDWDFTEIFLCFAGFVSNTITDHRKKQENLCWFVCISFAWDAIGWHWIWQWFYLYFLCVAGYISQEKGENCSTDWFALHLIVMLLGFSCILPGSWPTTKVRRKEKRKHNRKNKCETTTRNHVTSDCHTREQPFNMAACSSSATKSRQHADLLQHAGDLRFPWKITGTIATISPAKGLTNLAKIPARPRWKFSMIYRFVL